MRRDVIRLSYSQIQRLDRCPWAWHARHVRGLVPLRRRRAPPVWGDAYHAAAAAVWRSRASLEQSGHWLDGRDLVESGRLDALAKLREVDVPGLDNEALAAEASQAAQEACRFVGPEWRVLWLDGEPVVERRLVVRLGEVWTMARGPHDERSGAPWRADLDEPRLIPVELVAVLDLALVHVTSGVVRVVDHKTTTSWPEEVGDALKPNEELDLDLRDDLQVRLYVLALRDELIRVGQCRQVERTYRVPRVDGTTFDVTLDVPVVDVEGWHLVRHASIGTEPHLTRGGRGPLTRAADHAATEEQWMTAIRRHGLRAEDYEPQIAQARLRRWQAWAPSEFTPRSLELARREALRAAEDVARYRDLEPDDAPRRRLPGRWQPHRPGRWSGSAPKTGAEAFSWAACAACDHRELCVAEAQGDDAHAALVLAAEFAPLAEVREEREAGEQPPCELDADEVD